MKRKKKKTGISNLHPRYIPVEAGDISTIPLGRIKVEEKVLHISNIWCGTVRGQQFLMMINAGRLGHGKMYVIESSPSLFCF